MRPETAYNLINKTFERWFNTNKNCNVFLEKKFTRAIDSLLKQHQSYERKVLKENPDYADIYPTKVYYEITDIEDIMNNMFYISDRWHCTGRLLYIKNVIAYLEEKLCLQEKKELT